MAACFNRWGPSNNLGHFTIPHLYEIGKWDYAHLTDEETEINWLVTTWSYLTQNSRFILQLPIHQAMPFYEEGELERKKTKQVIWIWQGDNWGKVSCFASYSSPYSCDQWTFPKNTTLPEQIPICSKIPNTQRVKARSRKLTTLFPVSLTQQSCF